MSESEIVRLREEIAATDKEILSGVARRLHLAEQIGLEKRLLSRDLRDPGTEGRVLSRILAESAGQGISEAFAEGLARLLIEESLRRQEAILPPDPVEGRVLVVGGAGRMGRWLSRFFQSRGHEVAVHDPAGPLEDFAFETDLAEGVAASDVVAVSVPMSQARGVLGRIAEARPRALVFDVCSLKSPVEATLRSMGRAGLRIASVHPMFGPGLWPLSSGNILFCDCGNGVAVLEAKDLFRPSGATLLDVSLDHHDELMSVLLGLGHLCLLTFARAVSESPFDVRGLRRPAGTTFSRLSAASLNLLEDSPSLLREIQALNPHTPQVHRRLREVLGEWERATLADDPAAFYDLIARSRDYLGGA